MKSNLLPRVKAFSGGPPVWGEAVARQINKVIKKAKAQGYSIIEEVKIIEAGVSKYLPTGNPGAAGSTVAEFVVIVLVAKVKPRK